MMSLRRRWLEGWSSVLLLLAVWSVCTDGLLVQVPDQVVINELGSVNITCNVTDVDPDDSIFIRWTRPGDDKFQPQDSQFLVLRQVTTDQAGVYRCSVMTSSGGDTQTADTTLIVEFFPRWDFEALQKFAASVGSSGSIECKLHSVPDPTFYWQNQNGINMTSSADYTISSAGTMSTLVFYSVRENNYGVYTCRASNSAGQGSFELSLQPPGVPDAPRNCSKVSLNSSAAVMRCYPGYAGGEDPDFVVYSTKLNAETKKLDTSVVWEDGAGIVTATGLWPNTNYTLRVFGENIHGESLDAIGVYVQTPDGPVPEEPRGFSIELVAIICGAGALVLIILISTIVICVCKRRNVSKDNSADSQRNLAPESPKSPSQAPGRPRSYMMEDSDNNYNLSQEDAIDHGYERRQSWGSFKKPSRSAGNSNPGFQTESGSSSPAFEPRVADYNRPSPSQPYTINLDHQPGESEVGFDNRAYHPSDHSSETSFTAPHGVYANLPLNAHGLYSNLPDPQVERRRRHADPLEKAKRLSSEQPNLCGLGALTDISVARGGIGQPNARPPPPVPPNAPEPVYAPPSVHTPQPVYAPPPAVTPEPAYASTPVKPNIPVNTNVPQDSSNQLQPRLNKKHRKSSRKKSKRPAAAVAAVNPQRPVQPVTPVQRTDSIAPLNPRLSPHFQQLSKTPSFTPEVPWELPREQLAFKKKIGEGSFGEVWRAKAEGIFGRPGKQTVAVKMLKDMYTQDEQRCLLKELQIMQTLQPHPNIISLLGCCTSSEPFCVIMEYAANGNLQDLLRRQRSAFMQNDLNKASPKSNKERINLTARDLTIFTLHVASGMDYIASRQLLHRDLAARNVLVDKQLVCKVSDFGSARDIADMREYESITTRRLPLRWMAPESLMSSSYSTASDVWSFGILLWEVVTLGSSPYPGMSGQTVNEFVQKGCRMAKPTHCSDVMYQLMKDCWHQFPPRRPDFSTIRQRLATILDQPGSNMFVDQMSDNAYDILSDQPGEKC